jgi:GT2 family glycosyltransferase
MAPAVSVVIASLSDPEGIDPVAVLEAQPFDDYEVIVRDDPGASTARNAGIREASADNIVFLDDDAIPRGNYLPAAVDALAENPIVGGRIHHPGDGAISRLTGGYDKGETRHYPETRVGSFRRGATGVSGCNMAFRREVFETVGYFDTYLEWGHEETDLVRRALSMGYRVLYDPDMAVTHSLASSALDYWDRCYRFGAPDLRYDRKWRVPLSERVPEVAVPLRLEATPAASAVATVGNVCRSAGYLRALLDG